VTGQVLLPARARFARGRPEGVALLGEFLESLRDAAEAGADLPPNPANDRAWRVLAEASLARADGTRDGHWSDVPRRALRHLTADPRTAVGLAFVSAGGLLVLALGVGALT
jgi:hypothetical protein